MGGGCNHSEWMQILSNNALFFDGATPISTNPDTILSIISRNMVYGDSDLLKSIHTWHHRDDMV